MMVAQMYALNVIDNIGHYRRELLQIPGQPDYKESPPELDQLLWHFYFI